MKKNLGLILVFTATIVLAVIAIVTAIKLYQIGEKPVAPTAPESKPEAAETKKCTITFNIESPPPTTPPPTTPPPTPLECWDECEGRETECPTGQECQDVDGIFRCVDPDCPEEEDCECSEETPTPTPTETPTPTPTSTPSPECYEDCDTDSDCPGDLVCSDNLCVNPECPEEEDCVCPTPTPSEEPTSTPTTIVEVPSTPQPTASPIPVPKAGVISPTFLTALGGAILLIIGLLL